MKHYDSKGIPMVNTGGAVPAGAGISAGTQSVNTGTVVFSNSNGISFGMSNSNQVTASYTVPSTAGLISAVNFSGGSTSSNLTQFKFADSNGVTFGLNTGSVLTATVATNYQSSNANYLTSQSNQAASNSAGSFTFQTLNFSNANNVTFGTSVGGIITASVAATVAQSVQPVAVSNSAGSFTFATLNFSNANNVTFGTSAGGIITASVAATVAQSVQPVALSAANGSAAFSTLSFSNVNGVSFATAAGPAIQGSVAAGATATGNLGAIAINALTTYTSGTVVFSNSNGVTFGTNAQTVTADARFIHSTSDIFSGYVSTAFGGIPTGTSGVVSVVPFVLDEYVSVGAMNLLASMSFVTNGTSSGRQTAGFQVGLYTRGTGANSTTIGTIASQLVQWSITANNSTHSINQITQTLFSGFGATAQTTSAGVNITSAYTGMKLFALPINSLLSPGCYWIAINGTNSTSSVNVGISLSTLGVVLDTNQTAVAPMGSMTSAYSLGHDPLGHWHIGLGSWSSAGSVTGIPVSMAFTSITAGHTRAPFVRFWST
jgi:hypothetical protein